MKLYRLHYRQRFPVSPERAWTFFSDPANLRRITPAWLDFRLTGEFPTAVYPGLIVTYRIRPLAGIPVDWVTEITHVIEGTLFVDEQLFGPYRFWQHQHHFRSIPPGVEVEDLVWYALPFGSLGRLMHRLFIRRRLEAIFAFRRRVLGEILGGADARASGEP